MIRVGITWILKALRRLFGTVVGISIVAKVVHTIQAIISQRILGQQYMTNRLYAHRLRHPYSLVLDLDETLVRATRVSILLFYQM